MFYVNLKKIFFTRSEAGMTWKAIPKEIQIILLDAQAQYSL